MRGGLTSSRSYFHNGPPQEQAGRYYSGNLLKDRIAKIDGIVEMFKKRSSDVIGKGGISRSAEKFLKKSTKCYVGKKFSYEIIWLNVSFAL